MWSSDKVILYSLGALLFLAGFQPTPVREALSLDGHVNNGTGGGPVTLTLSTTKANDIIVVHVFNESASPSIYTVSGITDSAGLSWAKRSATTSPDMVQYGGGSAGVDDEVWWALATSTLSSDTITVNLSGTTDCISAVAFGVNGANISNPWDTNASLPAKAIRVGGVSAPSVSGISTTNTNAMILGFMGSGTYGSDDNGAAYAYGSGYTGIDQNIWGGCGFAAGVADEYQIVSTAQSNISAALGGNIGSGEGWFMVGDAIAGASQPTGSGRIIRLTGRVVLIGGVRLGGTSPIPRSSYDPATVAWVNAVTTAGGTVSTTQENYVNTLITCYKSAGIFSLMDREWLLWSDNVQQAETDLIHDDTWTSYGTPGFTADAGYTPDGSTSYLDTNYNLSSGGGNFSQNSASVDLYVTHDGGDGGGGDDIAANNNGSCPNTYIAPDGYGDDEFDYALNDCTFPAPADLGAVGLWAVSRTNSTLETAYQNGTVFSTTTDSSDAPPNASLYIGAVDDTGGTATHFANDTIAMVGIGGGLTGTQEAAKAACDDAYATSKGFNVF